MSERSLADPLVVNRLGRIREVKHHTRMRLRASTISELLREVDRTIEVQATISIDINIQGFEISWRIDQTNLASLHEVVSDYDVFLIRRDFDIMRSDSWLDGGWIVEALDVGQVANVKRGDMVSGCKCEVRVFPVLGYV